MTDPRAEREREEARRREQQHARDRAANARKYQTALDRLVDATLATLATAGNPGVMPIFVSRRTRFRSHATFAAGDGWQIGEYLQNPGEVVPVYVRSYLTTNGDVVEAYRDGHHDLICTGRPRVTEGDYLRQSFIDWHGVLSALLLRHNVEWPSG